MVVFWVFAAVSVLLMGGLLYILVRLARGIWRRRQAERILLESEEREKNRYRADPDLLRGHDLVAAMWFDRLRGSALADQDVESLVVAAGTAIDHYEGRRYDGRPIQQGWMTEEDFEFYFRFLDSFGDAESRYEAIYKANACDLRSRLDLREKILCDRDVRSKCGFALGEVSDWMRKRVGLDALSARNDKQAP